MEKYNVFLGGTCAESTWREQLMPMLDKFNITYFNPVVDDWTEECQVIENWHKENDDYNLFVITKEMQGCFLKLCHITQSLIRCPYQKMCR